MNRFTDFYNGNCDNAYELLGCHKVEEGVYHFAVWAPNAKAVSVVGDFNNWLVNHDNLELQDGIWQITINGARNGDCYKYAITTQSGTVIYKADPYARYSQLRPQTASVIYDEDPDFAWSDEKWMEQLAK